MKKITFLKSTWLLVFSCFICFRTQAQTIPSLGEEIQITNTTSYETTPVLGNDGTSDLVVYTVRPDASGAGDIWYQRIVDGALSASPVQVTFSATDDELNDVWGDFIVFTAYDVVGSSSGTIMLYQISTGTLQSIHNASYMGEPHIHDNYVVWREGGSWSAQIMLYDIDWLGTSLNPIIIAGPEPPTFQVQLEDRFIVWTEFEDGQFDVHVRDLDDATTFAISSTPMADEANPSTEGAWVVWSAQEHGATSRSIVAMNVDTWQTQVIVDDGAVNLNPSISGDLIVWESTINGDMDIFAYRISSGKTYQITTQTSDQYLNDVLGNLIVYADNRNGESDIYASSMPDVVNIPDDNFERALIEFGYDDVEDDYVLVSKISGIPSLDVSSRSISDLSGIEAFTNLTELNCYNNQITSLNVSNNIALTLLDCRDNQLTSLDLSANNSLSILSCSRNQLTSLDVSQNTVLTKLYCFSNALTSLDLSDNTNLTYLSIRENKLTNINLSFNIKLTYLNISENELINIDLSNNTNLTELKCSQNQLTSLNLFENLALIRLYCSENQIVNLDLSRNTALVTIGCNDNQLSSLNIKNGFNESIHLFNATRNPGLYCIMVDNEEDARERLGALGYNWFKDEIATYSEDCSIRTYIPDINFERALIEKGIDKEGIEDQSVLTSALSNRKTLSLVDLNISDLTGIEDFKSLESFSCSNNLLTNLDVTNNIALRYLYCRDNQLTNIDLSNNIALLRLACSGNNFTSLDLSQNSALTTLYCYMNQLTGLDLSQNTALIYLACQYNLLTSINLRNGNNSLITDFNASHNPSLTCINVDDETIDHSGWTVDEGVIFSNDCESVDNEPPFMDQAPADITVNCDAIPEPANIIAMNDPITPLPVAFTEERTDITCENSYLLTRTWTATDDAGNTSKVSQVITVVDDVSPIITAPADVTIECDIANDPASTGVATATDNCSENITIAYSDVFVAGYGNTGVITRTWTAADECGNTSSVVQTIAIVDNTPPVITCPADVALECEDSSDPTNTGYAVASDNCDETVEVSHSDAINLSTCSHTYSILRTWTATDACGNSVTCIQTINIVDTSPPVIACPADVTLECGSETTPDATGTATATDNCDNAVVVTYNDVITDGSCPQEETIERTWTATDACGNSSGMAQMITIVDTQPPDIAGVPDNPLVYGNDPGQCGSIVNYPVFSATDLCSEEVTLSALPASGSFFDIGNTTVIVSATDECGNVSTESFEVTVTNELPDIISNTTSEVPMAINTTVFMTATSSDDNLETATWYWGDGSSSEGTIGSEINGDHEYSEPGVYTVTLSLTDLCGETASLDYQYVVIYDSDGGFVTGGGWIDSPLGASIQYPNETGKAKFGFVSKYDSKKGGLKGNLNFKVKDCDLKLKSDVYYWLVIAGSKAMFKGEGTLNGSGTYGFLISAIDGDLYNTGEDKFRIKIWDKLNGNEIVYDNQLGEADDSDPTTELGGGSIVIHTSKHKKGSSIPDEVAGAKGFEVKIYPNPFDNFIRVDLLSEQSHQIIIDMIDMNGRVIEHMYTGRIVAGLNHHFELNTREDLIPGYYMIRIRNVKGESLGRQMILKQ